MIEEESQVPQEVQAEKPPSPEVEKMEDLTERLDRARTFIVTELLKSVKATERADNGDCIQSDELKVQHLTTIKLARPALTAIESEAYTEFVVNSNEDRWRSAIRKKQLEWSKLEKTDPTVFAEVDDCVARLTALRAFAQASYEEAFIDMEKADNGEVKIDSSRAFELTTQQNFSGMLVPMTDDGDFFWEWRGNLIAAHRDPERMGDDGDDFF